MLPFDIIVQMIYIQEVERLRNTLILGVKYYRCV